MIQWLVVGCTLLATACLYQWVERRVRRWFDARDAAKAAAADPRRAHNERLARWAIRDLGRSGLPLDFWTATVASARCVVLDEELRKLLKH